MEYQQNAITIHNHSEKTSRNNPMLTVIKSIVLLFIFSTEIGLSWAEEKNLIIDNYTNGKLYVLTNREITDNELSEIRKKYKTDPIIFPYEVNYKIDGKTYTMTDEDLSYLDKFDVLRLNRQFRENPNDNLELYDLIQVKKEKKENDTIRFNPTAIATYQKGSEIPLIPEKILRKTNNLWLYLGYGLTDEGRQTRLYPTLNTVNPVYYIKKKDHHEKKKQLINNYKKIIKPVASLKMMELKEKFALSEIEISYCLTLQKDNYQEIYELFFHKLDSKAKSENEAFLVINLQAAKFYYLVVPKRQLTRFFVNIL